MHAWSLKSKRVAIISWRWDIADASQYLESSVLQRCFTRAEGLGFEYVMVDVVTLDQASVNASAVLYFVRSYARLPVIVGIESDEDRTTYLSRFWTNYEMLLYKKNTEVVTLSESLDPPLSDVRSNRELLANENISATYNLDRLRLFLLELPFPRVFLSPPLSAIAQLNNQKTDLPLDKVLELMDCASVIDELMLGGFFRFINSRAKYCPLVFIWLILFYWLPPIPFPSHFVSCFRYCQKQPHPAIDQRSKLKSRYVIGMFSLGLFTRIFGIFLLPFMLKWDIMNALTTRAPNQVLANAEMDEEGAKHDDQQRPSKSAWAIKVSRYTPGQILAAPASSAGV